MSYVNNSARRFYLMKRLSAREVGMCATELVWRGKQEAVPGTALPDGFPSRTALADVGYTAKEDLDGADCDELADYVGLSPSQSEAVFAALAAI